jgi:hypothetical protein
MFYQAKRTRLYSAIIVLVAGLLLAACGASGPAASNPGAAARLNKDGNEAFIEGMYDQVLAVY